jgi:ADP-ribose pyrophosphatase
MKPWQRVEPTSVSKIGWRTITTKTFIKPDGMAAVFDTMYPDGQQFAGIIGLTSDNQVIVARQFRPGPELVMDEIAGGFVDGDETPVQAAERELLEETGYKAGTMKYLGVSHKDAYLNAKWHYFLARDCVKQAEQELDDNEHVDVHLVSIDEFIDNAKNDRVTDQGAVLLAYDDLKRINNGGK